MRPWRPALAATRSGRLVAGHKARLRVFAPLDGSVRLRLRSAPRGTLIRAAQVIDPAAPGGSAIEATVCGDRAIDVEVSGRRSGRFVLEVLG